MVNTLKNLETHLYPQTIEEVIDLLQDPQTAILAGGTELTLERNNTIKTLIDLQKMNLDYIREDENNYYIGAMTNAYQIYTNQALPKSLRDAARYVGDITLLHAVTIGGNLAKLYHWVDLPPILWALNAKFIVYTPKQVEMNADDFFAYSIERNVYSRKHFITEIIVPKESDRVYSSYQCLNQATNDKGQLNLAFYAEWDEKLSLKNVKIVLGGAMRQITRLNEIEKSLDGKKISVLENEVAELDIADLDLISDYKSSKEYRRHILRIYLKRAVAELREISGVM